MSRFGRRGFLIGSAAGGLAALLPWTRAHSQELPRPKRLVLFFTPPGTLFAPAGTPIVPPRERVGTRKNLDFPSVL